MTLIKNILLITKINSTLIYLPIFLIFVLLLFYIIFFNGSQTIKYSLSIIHFIITYYLKQLNQKFIGIHLLFIKHLTRENKV